MTTDSFQRVRVRATGEEGNIAQKDGATFLMRTHVNYNTPAVWVFFEETGEFRVYAQSALEYLPTNPSAPAG